MLRSIPSSHSSTVPWARLGARAALGPWAALVASTVLLGGCDSAASAPPAPPPPEVTVVQVSPRSVQLPYEYPGRLEGSREVQVRARVSGILLRRAYEEGRAVQQGQTLFVIDPAPYQAEVEAAEAQLAEEKAKLARAERELARLEPLAAARAVSQREYDAAISEMELTQATRQSAEARLRKARLDLSYTKVEAPISGVTSRARYSEGSLVGPGEDSLLTLTSKSSPSGCASPSPTKSSSPSSTPLRPGWSTPRRRAGGRWS